MSYPSEGTQPIFQIGLLYCMATRKSFPKGWKNEVAGRRNHRCGFGKKLASDDTYFGRNDNYVEKVRPFSQLPAIYWVRRKTKLTGKNLFARNWWTVKNTAKKFLQKRYPSSSECNEGPRGIWRSGNSEKIFTFITSLISMYSNLKIPKIKQNAWTHWGLFGNIYR